MKKLLLAGAVCFVSILFFSLEASAQDVQKSSKNGENEYYSYDLLHKKPRFRRSKDANAFVTWVHKKIEYPVAAQEAGIQGRVVLKFIIEKNGRVSNVEVVKSVDPILDNEAVRVVSSSPKWKPGKLKGKRVRVSYAIPIKFTLQ